MVLIVILIHNHSVKSGSYQTALKPKLGDEQLTSDISVIKVMVGHVIFQTTFTHYHKTQQALCKASNNSTFTH